MQKQNKKRIPVLGFWIMCILFPFVSLYKNSSFVRHHFFGLYRWEPFHVFLHLLLFSGLVILFFWVFNLKYSRRWFWCFLAIIFGFGFMQKILQLQIKHRSFGYPEIFDLVVDFTGALIGLILVYLFQRKTRELKPTVEARGD
ncbi:MAG: VanZ family protein [Anaerolineales bacterium]|nr:VanZ family protein [Anaerolineales bacterium]